MADSRFTCNDHVDKSLRGWWVRNSAPLKCEECNNLATWIWVRVPENTDKTDGAVPAGTER